MISENMMVKRAEFSDDKVVNCLAFGARRQTAAVQAVSVVFALRLNGTQWQ